LKATTLAGSTTGDESRPRVVWDPFVRLFHWSLVAGFVVNYWVTEPGKTLHQYVGYTIASLLLLRLAWGVVGPRAARFATWAPTPGRLREHIGALRRREHRRYDTHNPLGGAMMLALMTLIAMVGVTGWMQTLDAYWGVEWVKEVHEALATAVLVLVPIHVAGAVFESRKTGERLIRGMITGRR
jgi:cytochrome b